MIWTSSLLKEADSFPCGCTRLLPKLSSPTPHWTEITHPTRGKIPFPASWVPQCLHLSSGSDFGLISSTLLRAVWAPWLCVYLCDTWGDLRSNQNQTPAQHEQSPEAVNQSPRSTARFWVTRHKPNLKACNGGNKSLHFAIKQVTQVPPPQKAASNRNSSSAVTPSHWHKKIKRKESYICAKEEH